MDGIYKDGGFNGHLALDDENGKVQIDGTFNMAQKISDFNLHASVQNLRPDKLNLSDKYADSDISFNLNADFSGSSIDDVNGRISLDSLVLNAPDNNGYSLDNLTITAGLVAGGEKEIQIFSPFMTAVVRGDYSYQTIPTSILQTMQRYIPSLITLKKSKKKPNNNFKFDIQLANADFFKKMFFIPLEVRMPASLKGSVNDMDGRLHVEGAFPDFIYNDTRYESVTLLCENPSDHFKGKLRGSMLMESGAMITASVDAEAQQDRFLSGEACNPQTCPCFCRF